VRLRITGWREGLRKISLAKLLQKETALSLRSARAVVHGVMDDIEQLVEIPDGVDASALLEAVRGLGAEAELEDGEQKLS
jgi:hypothetical protein